MRRLGALLTLVLMACSGQTSSSQRASTAPAPLATPIPSPLASASPSPEPNYAPYYIESLRSRNYPGGKLEIRDQMFQGPGFTKSHMSWPSNGQTMTGTISMPDGAGPFPVVIVNHGHIPVERYWIGQDSGIFGDPMASHGFISVAPNYPGYAGSGAGVPDTPTIVATVISVLDLVSSLSSLPQADTSRVAMMGHSNGGGVSLLSLVIDPRIRAYALYAPVSSDMADNARKWWLQSGSMGPLGKPDANPEGYAHISPRNYLDRFRAPVIFLQGTADQDIPAAWTNASLEALKGKGVKTEAVWFPGAHHDLVDADLARANAAAEAWIRQALS